MSRSVLALGLFTAVAAGSMVGCDTPPNEGVSEPAPRAATETVGSGSVQADDTGKAEPLPAAQASSPTESSDLLERSTARAEAQFVPPGDDPDHPPLPRRNCLDDYDCVVSRWQIEGSTCSFDCNGDALAKSSTWERSEWCRAVQPGVEDTTHKCPKYPAAACVQHTCTTVTGPADSPKP